MFSHLFIRWRKPPAMPAPWRIELDQPVPFIELTKAARIYFVYLRVRCRGCRENASAKHKERQVRAHHRDAGIEEQASPRCAAVRIHTMLKSSRFTVVRMRWNTELA